MTRHCPEGATFAWAYKAEALRVLGRHDEAFEAHLKIPEEPEEPGIESFQ